MKHRMLALLGVISLAFAGAAGAMDQSVTSATDYLRHQPPAITGTVVSSTQHSLVMNSDDGDRVAFDLDSRTVVPMDLTEGTHMRVEFHAMDSGRYLAKRVTPIEGSDAGIGRMQTSMRTDIEGTEIENAVQEQGEENAETHTYENTSTTSQNSTTTSQNSTVGAKEDEPKETASEEAREGETHDRLPATSSSRALVGVLGALALVMGSGLWMSRRRRSV